MARQCVSGLCVAITFSFCLPQWQVVRESEPWAKAFMLAPQKTMWWFLICCCAFWANFVRMGRVTRAGKRELPCEVISRAMSCNWHVLLLNSFVDSKVSFRIFPLRCCALCHLLHLHINPDFSLFMCVKQPYISSYLCADFFIPVIVLDSFLVCQASLHWSSFDTGVLFCNGTQSYSLLTPSTWLWSSLLIPC